MRWLEGFAGGGVVRVQRASYRIREEEYSDLCECDGDRAVWKHSVSDVLERIWSSRRTYPPNMTTQMEVSVEGLRPQRSVVVEFGRDLGFENLDSFLSSRIRVRLEVIDALVSALDVS